MKFTRETGSVTRIMLYLSVFFAVLAIIAWFFRPAITFKKALKITGIQGRPGNWLGGDVIETSDGGYALLAETTAIGSGENDFYLVKTDRFGNEIFSNAYGGKSDEYGNSLVQTSDGGYALFGKGYAFEEKSWDMYLVKADANGEKLWDKYFGGERWEEGFSVKETTDGGLILFGATFSTGAGEWDMYLVKTDKDGNEEWSKTYGDVKYDKGASVAQTTDGGYILFGKTNSFGAEGWDMYLVKTDKDGNKEWEQFYGGSADDIGTSVAQTSDGGYVIFGYSMSFGRRDWDMAMYKTDSKGEVLWEKSFGGTGREEGYSVKQTSDGGYILCGLTDSLGAGSYDMYLIKTDSSGNNVWERVLGGINSEYGYSVKQTSDGGYILFGYNDPAQTGTGFLFLVKTDANGDVSEK